MKIGYKMFIVLTLISLLSGGLLSAWDSITAPRIKMRRINETKQAIKQVLPPYDFTEQISKEQMTLYVARKEDQQSPIGIAFKLVGSGFQGQVSIMVGVEPDFSRLTGLKVLEQSETPGLGSKISEDPSNKENPKWFSQQFVGLHLSPFISVLKNIAPSEPYEIQAITGATISSKAIAGMINDQLPTARKLWEENKP